MLNINISTPSSVMEELRVNFKEKRLSLDLTQEGLSNKSSVSLGSLKRFEKTGLISLESLLKLALVLECLDDFKTISTSSKKEIQSLEDLNTFEKPSKKRGSIK